MREPHNCKSSGKVFPANAAMAALLAEEEKEKAAASSKAGTSKRNKGRK